MSTLIGKQALVVDAGMGGLTAARVLADYFEQVLVLERDTLPAQANARAGIPQGKHVHALLAGGQQALGELFPGFERDLVETGAVALTTGLDVLMERPGPDEVPQRDLGFVSYAQSRPEQQLKVGMAMGKLAARDPAVHKLVAEVAHLLKPRRVYQDPEMQQRLHEVMAEA